MAFRTGTVLCLAIAGWACASGSHAASWVLSGNETKIDLSSGAPRRIVPAEPDSLTLLDFAVFPPRVTPIGNVPNSVIGPPSNVAIAPDGRLALIANSIRLDPANSTNWIPESYVALLDLGVQPPRIVGRVETGAQPSGISITRDGRTALVANRAAGTLSVLTLQGVEAQVAGEVSVCGPTDGLSDVAISPDRRVVLASVQKGGYLAVLKWDGALPVPTGQKVSTYGQPYRVAITPDGQLGLTAGAGAGNGLDSDALTVVDLQSNPIRTVDYVPLGAIPESFEVSPDGRWVAAVVMAGSNLPAEIPTTPKPARWSSSNELGGPIASSSRSRSAAFPKASPSHPTVGMSSPNATPIARSASSNCAAASSGTPANASRFPASPRH